MSAVGGLVALVMLLAGSDFEERARAARAAPPAVTKVVAAGDIASCASGDDEATATLVGRLAPDVILTLGDNAYPDGSVENFRDCYAPGWGRFVNLTYPSPGNHDYHTPRAAGYHAYFGRRAPRAYYSRNVGDWHVVSLNSEIDVRAGSRQERWLRADLARDRHRCQVLYWHRPRWSGGTHGSDDRMGALWRTAYRHGVDLVLAGHDHNYQRFHRLDARGGLDHRFGIRQVVAGTGGAGPHYPVGEIGHRVAADSTTFGVVVLLLKPRGYDLRFAPAADGTFRDSITRAPCHGAPPRRPGR